MAYTVAIDNDTGKSIKAWQGGYRAYNIQNVAQYKVFAESQEEAKEKAERLHNG